MFHKIKIITMLLLCAESMAKDQKEHAGVEKLLSRVRRQTAIDLGGECDNTVMCQMGNGGQNSQCAVPPMDEGTRCLCLPGFESNPICLPSCTSNSDCPLTNMCVNGECSPPCPPTPCNLGTCPPPLLCNGNNVCVPDCRAILPLVPTTPAPTTTTPAPPTTTPSGGGTTSGPPIVDTPPILGCNQPNGERCQSDMNAVCTNNVCVCIPGTILFNGNCVPGGGPHQPCDSNNQCPLDRNAICNTNTGLCECRPGTTLFDGSCVITGLPGGMCEFGECPGDLNAVCVTEHGIELCVCKPGTTKIESSCLQDGAVGGRCDGDGFMCTRDQYAECKQGELFGICQCIEGARPIEAMCVLDGVVGGKCNGQYKDLCTRDTNAECMDGYCVCKPGTKKVEGSCVETGKAGTECTDIGYCPYDILASCSSNKCTCNIGSVKMGDNCVADGYDGGYCSHGKCFNKYSICDWATNRCVCRHDSTAVAGKCVSFDFLYWIHVNVNVYDPYQKGTGSPELIHIHV
ncbi:tenascin-X-like [Ruditapes philippinarum]|uniref:tenascin-X-like n=1 Tax=Ruditapes philippinarum TaxID=129788 RepID=UPI00295A73C0|nr:tenascin-X-like [Ruditapes philippinarum]